MRPRVLMVGRSRYRLPLSPSLRAKFGLPINQEDMVYTLMTFSYVVIEGFRIMGYDMTERQRRSLIGSLGR